MMTVYFRTTSDGTVYRLMEGSGVCEEDEEQGYVDSFIEDRWESDGSCDGGCWMLDKYFFELFRSPQMLIIYFFEEVYGVPVPEDVELMTEEQWEELGYDD